MNVYLCSLQPRPHWAGLIRTCPSCVPTPPPGAATMKGTVGISMATDVRCAAYRCSTPTTLSRGERTRRCARHSPSPLLSTCLSLTDRLSVSLQMCLLAFEADMEKAFAAQLSQDKVCGVRRCSGRHGDGGSNCCCVFRCAPSAWRWWSRRRTRRTAGSASCPPAVTPSVWPASDSGAAPGPSATRSSSKGPESSRGGP